MLDDSHVEDTTSFLTGTHGDITPPNPSRLILALRQIGYSLEQALSDLIDNSINAHATTVLIRFVCDEENIVSIAVADDGVGMTESEIRNAMRFGSDRDDDSESLGKFGMGLKLASFSHAKALTVLTSRDGRTWGRQWTIEGIERGWECQQLRRADVDRALQARWAGIDLPSHGTLVVWDRLDKLPAATTGLRATLRTLQSRLQVHIGLHFHRFLEKGSLRVVLDQQRIGSREHQLQVPIQPLNPFGYKRSGHSRYPQVLDLRIDGVGVLQAEAHIWPANSESKNYSLGSNAAARQGIYFYRNARLIQAGGWNGLVKLDSEPHSSLARLRIELPPKLDSSFGLNVQKSAVIVPPGFSAALAAAQSPTGGTFEQYRHLALRTYRNHDNRALRDHPFVPGAGVSKKVHRLAWETLFPESEAVRPVDFVWADLPDETLFELDRLNQSIKLNRKFRAALLNGAKQSSTDVPLFKAMLLLLLEHDLPKERLPRSRKSQLERISTYLASLTSKR